MSLLRNTGRMALSWVFVASGLDVLQHPEKPTATAGWLFDGVRSRSPLPVPPDVQLVRANAAVQVLAGAALASGLVERSAAAVLIGSLIPTTLGGHAFWRHEDAVLRKTNRTQFGKNVSLLGGLLVTLGTTESPTRLRRPSRKGHR